MHIVARFVYLAAFMVAGYQLLAMFTELQDAISAPQQASIGAVRAAYAVIFYILARCIEKMSAPDAKK